MPWLSFITTTKKVFVWLRHHWQIPFLAVWTIATIVLTRRNSDAIIEVLKTKKTSYEKQMSTLKATHTDELLKRDKLLLQYQKTLQKVEAKYAAKEKELAEEERQLVKEIVAKSKGDTNAIRKEVQNLFGFDYAD